LSAVEATLRSDEELLSLIAEHQYHPERLVMMLWPWGEGELAGIEQPDAWQMDDFRELGEEMRSRNYNGVDSVKKILRAIGSGRGIGKSASVGMLVVILLAAFPDAKITVMANSGDQLSTKTWPEISKWMRRSIVAHWFEVNTSIIYRKGARDSWFAVPITWNLENPQASAGQQNIGSVNVIIFDEASEIPDKIAEVSLSGLTTGLPLAIARGNPTMATGFFADSLCGKYAYGYWTAKSIDSRTCRFPNKEELDEAIKVYGIDSDYVRVWILGLPPKSNAAQYFDEDLIRKAQGSKNLGLANDALIAACDFAWGGDDDNCVRFRHGLDLWSIPAIKIPGAQTREPDFMVAKLAEVLTKEWPVGTGARKLKVSMLFTDGSGISSRVVTRLRELGFKNIIEVNWMAQSMNPQKWKNVKAMMIDRLHELLQNGASIDDSKDLAADMRQMMPINYIPLQFEDKKLMKKRLGRSTDDLDALAMTTYMPVVSPDVQRQAREYHEEKPYVPASPYS